MIKIKKALIVSFLFCGTASFSQLKEANILYDNYAYFNSIKIYEKVANKGYKSAELFEKLGNSNFFNAQYIQANKWYTELFALNVAVDPIYYYRYSLTLKSNNQISKSDAFFSKFLKSNEDGQAVVAYANSKDYLDEIEKNSGRYDIEDAGVNSSLSDYGATVFNSSLVFTSTRETELIKKKKDSWTADYYSSLYAAGLSKENILSDVFFFPKEIQTQYHESTPAFSKDGKTMYFTRSNYLNNKEQKSLDNIMMLKIYRATFENGKWGAITELPFNNNQYNCAHPALSPDEKSLYFVSNMPGSYGESDIYRVFVGKNNSYGKPENLGANINTKGRETFPFVSDKNELYFSSDGHLGLGGLDVFMTPIADDKYSNKVINIGKPINSPFDDFCFFKCSNSKVGFFSSNRDGGKGKDDIYRFVEKKELNDLIKIENILVIDEETLKPVTGLQITVYDKNHNLLETLKPDINNKFSMVLNTSEKVSCYVEVKSSQYEAKEIRLNSDTDDLKNVQISLSKTLIPFTKDTDLSKLIVKNILFDLDKYKIEKEAAVELQKVVEFMNEFPTVHIEIRSYTDSRNDDDYNMKLSKRRAQAAMNYLISNGIAKDRIASKGFGESQLLNNCVNGVSCTEEEHKVNRRSEFFIMQL
jgi:outer membrane protein OmpA-like peptidoglycan-associated protein